MGTICRPPIDDVGAYLCCAETRRTCWHGLHSLNWIALGANALFILLHFVQTHLWYDGLAQDVSIWSSQGSVILMLVMILLMENQRRGLFWGKKAPISKETTSFARKYHGYVFAWATIYTFWYHPMESTIAHLGGFLYMFLLLLQGSLMTTRIHTNRVWMVVQEVTVLFHGTLVALMQGNGMWPMFFFGFGGLFILTQMHGLRLRSWMRWGFLGLYSAAALVTYSIRDISMLHQITWIPIIEYVGVFVLAGIIGLGLKIAGRRQVSRASNWSTGLMGKLDGQEHRYHRRQSRIWIGDCPSLQCSMERRSL